MYIQITTTIFVFLSYLTPLFASFKRRESCVFLFIQEMFIFLKIQDNYYYFLLAFRSAFYHCQFLLFFIIGLRFLYPFKIYNFFFESLFSEFHSLNKRFSFLCSPSPSLLFSNLFCHYYRFVVVACCRHYYCQFERPTLFTINCNVFFSSFFPHFLE